MKRLTVLLLVLARICTAQSFSFPNVSGWNKSDNKDCYNSDKLWEIIDGAAELFIKYDFIEMQRIQYVHIPDSTYFEVQAYLYKDSQNAFGMYSMERPLNADFSHIGSQSYQIEGALNMLAGNVYLKMYTNNIDTGTLIAMKKIAIAIAAGYQDSGFPKSLDLFPTDNKIINSEQMIAREFLGYALFSGVYQTRYIINGSECVLFLIEKLQESDIDQLLSDYGNIINVSIKIASDIVKVNDPNNGTIYLRKKGNLLYGVHGSNKKIAEILLSRL